MAQSHHEYCVYFGIVLVSDQSICSVLQPPLTDMLDYQTIDLPTCSCQSFATILVENGFFPTAPSQANLAISIDFLEFYYALSWFEQSADAVGAMAAALSKFYNRRGFPVNNAKVSNVSQSRLTN